jgi:hypothetical protein
MQPLSSATADIASIQSSWKTIADQCGQSDSSLGAFLAQGRPVRLENSTLSLCFGSDGAGLLAQNACQRKLNVLQNSLSRILSMNIAIRIEAVGSEQTLPEKKSSDATPPATEVVGINRQQRQQALNDPVVQMVLKGLDATPVEIQKIEIQSDDDLDNVLTAQEAD